MKLNKDKKEAYWLVSSHNCNKNLNIETVHKPMKILYPLQENFTYMYISRLKNELNLDATLKSLKKTLTNWQWRNLTVFDRIQITKTFAMLKLLLFRAFMLTFNKEFFQKLNTVLFYFYGEVKIKSNVSH